MYLPHRCGGDRDISALNTAFILIGTENLPKGLPSLSNDRMNSVVRSIAREFPIRKGSSPQGPLNWHILLWILL